jgi:hypothetical protein
MKPEVSVNICQIIPRNSDDDVGWFFINVDHDLPDDTGSCASIKLEIPVRLPLDADLSLTEPEVMQKAQELMVSALAALKSTTS